MTIDDIKQRLIRSGQALADAYNNLEESGFKTIPAKGGWPPAGVVGHLHMSETGILRILQAPGAPVERDSLSKAYMIENDFGNNGKRYVSPASIEPDLNRVEFAGAAEKMMDRRRKIVEMLDTMPTDEECIIFAHQFFGVMTRPEWALFVCIHGERHLRQLQGILADAVQESQIL